ncbi:sel1 repeat family protein [Chiayiivirga flava]|uniref:Sel1 repeat family protein n=1 Tax=Chiayiivirga flava TaxID=659595 RepID=A0A7W8D869_9GAMM|nr:sel1 repeat family protein [Chiayiivirga flava]MBB5209397.1 hypothetical protein [Chiayiivirga flava]
MSQSHASVGAVLLALGMIAAPAFAASGTGREQAPEKPVNLEIARGSDFMHYHPDLRFRRDGMQQFEAGNHSRAFELFQRAARYSDKPAQAMVADMFWDGRGVAADRCLAYVWMDLAAERGYPVFLAFRERYWSQLTDTERACATERGGDIYAEYGDPVAKERLEHMLRKRRMTFTGSRVGYVSPFLRARVPSNTGWAPVPIDQVYDRRFWFSKEYHEWQDEIWERPVRGVVEVGPIGGGDGATPAAEH